MFVTNLNSVLTFVEVQIHFSYFLFASGGRTENKTFNEKPFNV
jgi:hypothetical protein